LMQRLGAKSTIDETRTATFLELSRRSWNGHGRSWMPVPYTYYGAHTGRFSGTQGFNFTNLRKESVIRESIEAPPGYRVLHRDASQIECRIEAWLAHCTTLLEGFRQGRDVYCDFGSNLYRRPITKADEKERFSCKTAVLSLGYGCSAPRFQHALFIGQGGMSVDLPIGEAEAIVEFYRNQAYPEIPRLWQEGNRVVKEMLGGRGTATWIRAVKVHPNRIDLPNGLALRYPGILQIYDVSKDITYCGPKNERKKLYGAKLIENITQALARIVVTDVMCRVLLRTGFRPFMGTYDSWNYLVPEDEVAAFDHILAEEFCIPPAWAPDLPLASEGGWGRTLLDAERRVNQ
jgi:hypothetical protein